MSDLAPSWQMNRTLVSSVGLHKLPHLSEWTGATRLQLLNMSPVIKPGQFDSVIGWGNKPNTQRAQATASKHALGYYRLEDGFLCYAKHPARDQQRLSLIIDVKGIYYDATRASALELLLNRDDWCSDRLHARAEQAMTLILKHRFSKYNHHPSLSLPESLSKRLTRQKPKVLVIDQTLGDMSVQYGLVNSSTFDSMLEAAVAENSGAEVYVKTHPDVLLGLKQGYLSNISRDQRVTVISDDVNPLVLLERFDKVYTATSQMGFEALMLGKPVVCFGVPFYAGWGLTDDRQTCARRQKTRTITEVFAAAYLLYCRYLDPITHKRCELETILDYLVQQRTTELAPVNRVWCFGFSLWKRTFIKRFVGHLGEHLKFTSSTRRLAHARPGDAVLHWGATAPVACESLADGVHRWRIEDGFLRSVGLGSDLRRPASLVIDPVGIYYDPTQPSELENILESGQFTVHEKQRAERLVEQLRQSRISKYNFGDGFSPSWRQQAAGRRVILVPGQVEDDASVLLGTREINTNSKLLQAVRGANPDCFVVYKPHPDVTTGNRQGAVPESVLEACCDIVIQDVDIIDCLLAVDEIHTMTSLTGFEALLHSKKVYCYGMPFYAGWGLTSDRYLCERRKRQLTLDELVAGALIRYPIYFDWLALKQTTPEVIVERLMTEKAKAANPNQTRRKTEGIWGWVERRGRKLKYLLQALS